MERNVVVLKIEWFEFKNFIIEDWIVFEGGFVLEDELVFEDGLYLRIEF